MFILIFRDFNPEIHDVYKVAELIYDVDYRTFDYFNILIINSDIGVCIDF